MRGSLYISTNLREQGGGIFRLERVVFVVKVQKKYFPYAIIGNQIFCIAISFLSSPLAGLLSVRGEAKNHLAPIDSTLVHGRLVRMEDTLGAAAARGAGSMKGGQATVGGAAAEGVGARRSATPLAAAVGGVSGAGGGARKSASAAAAATGGGVLVEILLTRYASESLFGRGEIRGEFQKKFGKKSAVYEVALLLDDVDSHWSLIDRNPDGSPHNPSLVLFIVPIDQFNTIPKKRAAAAAGPSAKRGRTVGAGDRESLYFSEAHSR